MSNAWSWKFTGVFAVVESWVGRLVRYGLSFDGSGAMVTVMFFGVESTPPALFSWATTDTVKVPEVRFGGAVRVSTPFWLSAMTLTVIVTGLIGLSFAGSVFTLLIFSRVDSPSTSWPKIV